MPNPKSLISALALSASLGLLLPACSSDGTTRIGAVGGPGSSGGPGAPGAQGEPGPDGTNGEDGTDGVDGADGANGADGNFTVGDAGALSVGGLIGPNGLGGTGLLANTGDPANTNESLSALMTQTGGELSSASIFLASVIDETVPGGAPLVGTVLGVLDGTGQTLVQTANGDAYLVDGLLAAPGDLITATIGGATPIGSGDTEALIAISGFSDDQAQGSLLTVGGGSNGELLAADAGGALDLVSETLNIDMLDAGGTLNAVLPDQDLVSISGDSSLGLTIGDGLPVDGGVAIVDTAAGLFDGTDGLTGALDPILAGGGDLSGVLDPVLSGGDITGVLDPVLAGGGLTGALDPVLDPLAGGGDLTSVLDPVLEPVTGDDGLLGGALNGVTGEDGLLGGLLGGGE